MSDIRIGVDLGGTKIEAIALDRDGAIRARRRVSTPAHDYDEILRAIAALVREIEQETGRRGAVGVGSPGSLSTHTGFIKGSNTQVVNGKPLDADLAKLIGRPVRVENDANCFALSEAVDGAGQGTRVVFGVIIGTGVGGGVVVDGKIVAGRNHIGGEWGHTPLPWMTREEYPGMRCFCGHDGCIETFLCGAGLSREYRRVSGGEATSKEIVARADAGEAEALAALDAYQDRLSRALAMIVDILDPDVIALGGGVSNIARIYEGLTARVARHAFTDALDTKILRNVHGDSGGVRGAAWLWRDGP
ncbi:ROK family protein [Methylocystis parvus]|uniref:ROK family protein n=1 Tax=Methylocystis parvus TaxID=134 RepID=A0A6B8MAA1_9HYPH|nr:ROK family protein [Methylocystis parvus]QGM98213.1 ROK family protein [Methylocystis parvus]WBK01461.1 ROK family protein [Methylocystis parvus OBBP]